VLNGRFGPYLTKDKKNYRLPKGIDTEKITKHDCLEIIEKNNKTHKKS
jgi:DNA topoisomerase-1